MAIIATRRMALFESQFYPGDEVPSATWERLSMNRQRVLIHQHFAEIKADGEAPRKRGRPTGRKHTKATEA